MKQKSLLKTCKDKLISHRKGLIKLNPSQISELNATILFIQKENKTFAESQYTNNRSGGKPERHRSSHGPTKSTGDLSILIENINLLPEAFDRDLAFDYFITQEDLESLKKKYSFKNNSAVSNYISRMKKKIRKLFFKNQSIGLVDKKVIITNGTTITNILKKNTISKIRFKSSKAYQTCYLIKVKKTFSLNYNTTLQLSDYDSLINKTKIVFNLLSKTNQDMAITLLRNLVEGSYIDMKRELIEELSLYRWVNSKGYAFSLEIDTKLSELKLEKSELDNIESF